MPAPEEIEARVVPSALGEAILAHWKRIGEFTPEIRPLFCQIMPDHLHAILEVTRPMARPLGNAIGGFKTGCERIYQGFCRVPRACALGTGQGALGTGQGACALGTGQARLFAEGFQDSILFHARQLDNMFGYLRDNPRRLAVKRLFPDLFRAVRELRLPLQLNAPNPPKPSTHAHGLFSALGNRFLLDRPLLQVQVSRHDFGYLREPVPGGRGRRIVRDAAGEPMVEFSTPAYEEKRDALLAAAKRGTVLISPCVSDGERQIAREALLANLPLVTLQNKGFSPHQKPSGRYFDACADGRLLMLAPAAWPYLPGEKKMTRPDAMVLNRLCQWLAREGAAVVKYRGLAPSAQDKRLAPSAPCPVPPAQAGGVDARALAAVKTAGVYASLAGREPS